MTSRILRLHPLDLINFFLADVRGAFGPYLGIFLLTEQQWSPAAIGLVMTVGGLAGLVVQAPVGAFIDATRHKREVIVTACLILSVGALAVVLRPSFTVVLTANTLMAVVGAVFGPAVAAITLGLYGHGDLARRFGRNGAFDHAGNIAISLLAAAIGWTLSQSTVFLLVPVFAALTSCAVLAIRAHQIDHNRARGLDHARHERGKSPSTLGVLVTCRPLLIFAGCAALFHFANAAMLPLLGQQLALAHPGNETVLMSACVIAAQLVMLPIALIVGARADRWGRKPLFLAAFAILPLRGVLYTLSDNPYWLVGVQLLDGVGAGLFGALTPLLLADLMKGTGRYNLSQGAVGTVQGVGASLSNVVAGMVVTLAGYDVAYLVLAATAFVAFAVFLLAMPETRGPLTSTEPAGFCQGAVVSSNGMEASRESA
ncbi:MFS transporter [Rhizobium mesoamericanum]|uniref:MFS transporter n=1 Tax=Rhizobium mesoamericanum TaxID=1079800 RepID=UPI00041B3D10|nr:MFS transporter [Rhizobium mesoamericanum]